MKSLADTLLVATVLLGSACRSTPAGPAWLDLFDGRSLAGFATTDFGGQGEVAARDGRLHLGIGNPLTGVTWTGAVPHGDYELEVVGRRDDGGDFWCGLTFPVGDSHLTLVLGGWGGSLCGLSSLDGNDAAHNSTRVLRAFENGRDYAVRLTVTPARIDVHVDGEPLLAADLRGHTLGLRPEVQLSRPLGLCSFASAASFGSLRWRPLARN